jgi:peptidyl-prolyl cis-trans isomerase A (cyclophilin A)
MMKYFVLILGLFAMVACGKSPLPKVEIESSMGNIIVEVDTVHAPITASNFLKLVDQGVYLNACFYRVVRMDNQPQSPVKIEVVQGGLRDDAQIERYPPIQHETTAETGLKHLNGTISMARYGPGTASTEFFICVGDQPELDFGGKRNPDGQGFAAFGRVAGGMDIVRQIQQQEDEEQYLTEPVIIYNLKRIR